VLTFNEAVDPTTVNKRDDSISVSGYGGGRHGNYTLNGAVVTFTRCRPLAWGGATIQVAGEN